MTSQALKPNNCYQASLRFMMKHTGAGCVLVHGIVDALGNTGHAWVETSDRKTVLEVCRHPLIGQRREIPAAEYYRAVGAKNCQTFDLKAACEMVISTGLWGPWEPRL